jgi:hypothetical protein
VKSGYLKTAQFSPKPVSTVDVATVQRKLKNVRNLQRSKMESHSDTEHILVYLITIFLTSNLLFCIALYVGHLVPRVCQRRPVYIPL